MYSPRVKNSLRGRGEEEEYHQSATRHLSPASDSGEATGADRDLTAAAVTSGVNERWLNRRKCPHWPSTGVLLTKSRTMREATSQAHFAIAFVSIHAVQPLSPTMSVARTFFDRSCTIAGFWLCDKISGVTSGSVKMSFGRKWRS